MKSTRSRLDRFISQELCIKKQDVRLLIAQNRVQVDNKKALSVDQIISNFSRVEVDGQLLQCNTPHYIMINKPINVVSATKDAQHKTVIDLLPFTFKHDLHIVGRLDLKSTGLLLLTNDSRWSRQLMSPESKVSKQYRVTLEETVTADYVEAFEKGMYFSYEDITTRPVKLKIISNHVAELELTEGRYHQIKRMFGRFRNPVLELHRFAIGNLSLDANLASGESRLLSKTEMEKI